jgi:hypothetical protein
VELTQTLVNAFVVAAVGAVLGLMVAGFRREVRDEIKGLRTELRGDIAELRVELKGDMAELRAEMHEEIRGVRSDLTQVALAVGATPRAQAE